MLHVKQQTNYISNLTHNATL